MKWVIDLPEDMKTLLDVIRNEVIPEKKLLNLITCMLMTT